MPARKSKSDTSVTANRMKSGVKRPTAVNHGDEGSPAKKVKISHASHHTVEGVVLTVGEGDVGQLGLGADVMERSRLGLVPLPSKCVQVVAGGMHTVCLTGDGKIYTFGCNDEGALGRDTSEDDSETTPARLPFDLKVVQVSAGDSHTALLVEDGSLYMCGSFRDANGSIGLTEAGPQKTPVLIPCDRSIIKIASGGDHILALTVDGQVYSAGCAEQGQLGRVAECFSSRSSRKGLAPLLKLTQVRFKGKPKFDDIWAGTYVSFAKTRSGQIYAWGLNNYYQLGIDDMENRFTPALVDSLPADKVWTCISGGQHHTVALNIAGEVYVFGRGTYGQLGLGEEKTADMDEPVHLTSIKDTCVSVEAASSVSFAVSNNGKAFGWGMGTSKQLSSGTEDDQMEPQPLGGKQLDTRKVIMVSAGGQHTVVLAADSADK